MSVSVLGVVSEGRTHNEGADKHREYRRTYRVQTTSQRDDAVRVTSAAGLPKRGDSWKTLNGEGDHQALCCEISAEPAGTPYLWHVTCTFSTNIPNPAGEVQINFSSIARQKILDYAFEVEDGSEADIQGRQVAAKKPKPGTWKGATHSNRSEAYDPPVTYEEAIPVLTITRNEPNFDPRVITKFTNKVNREIFFGFAPGMCRMVNITVSNNTDQFGKRTRQVTYEIHIHPEGWVLQILDVGTKYWDKDMVLAGGELIPAKGATLLKRDADGEPQKFLLNGKGGRLEAGKKPEYRKWVPYREEVFAELGLPQNL